MYVCQHFQISPLKLLVQLKPNFMSSLLGTGQQKFVQTVLVTWPRWPPCPYMVKTLKYLLLWNQKGWWLWNFVCNIGCLSTTKFVQMMTLGWSWPILRQCQFWSLMLWIVWEKGKTLFFYRNYCRLWFETNNRWPKWQEVSVDIKIMSPWGCMSPAPGLYTCIKSWKNCIKSDFKEISLKLATNG